jgi:hypothetical protein
LTVLLFSFFISFSFPCLFSFLLSLHLSFHSLSHSFLHFLLLLSSLPFPSNPSPFLVQFQRDLIEVEREESEEARLTRVTYMATQESSPSPSPKLIAANDAPAMVQLGERAVYCCITCYCYYCLIVVGLLEYLLFSRVGIIVSY